VCVCVALAQAENAKSRVELNRLQDADEEMRLVKDENRVLQERLDKLCNMQPMKQSVKAVDRSDKLRDFEREATQLREDLAYLRKELHVRDT